MWKGKVTELGLRFAIFKVCIIIHHITKTDVIKIVFVTKDNKKLLLYHQKFSRAHQTSQIELAQYAVKLELRDSAIVHAVVVLKERENLNATNTHAVSQSVHD